MSPADPTTIDPVTAEELGPFLRARRAGVRPGDVGLPAGGVRRVRGLRREEVAVLAGVSIDYYTRLEQGRERAPSAQVLTALARCLDLDEEARQHLFRLAGLALTSSPAPADVDPDLLDLLEEWTGHPAMIVDRVLDVLAQNALGAALHRGFGRQDNLVRMIFLDPHARSYYADWPRAAEAAVANLRSFTGHEQGSARLAALVEELSRDSAEFRRLWSEHEVRGKTREAKDFRHPDVGALTLTYHAFDVRGAPGQQLIVYRAAVGGASHTALRLLESVAATDGTRQAVRPARPPAP